MASIILQNNDTRPFSPDPLPSEPIDMAGVPRVGERILCDERWYTVTGVAWIARSDTARVWVDREP